MSVRFYNQFNRAAVAGEPIVTDAQAAQPQPAKAKSEPRSKGKKRGKKA